MSYKQESSVSTGRSAIPKEITTCFENSTIPDKKSVVKAMPYKSKGGLQ